MQTFKKSIAAELAALLNQANETELFALFEYPSQKKRHDGDDVQRP